MKYYEIVEAATKDASLMHQAHVGRDGGTSIVKQTASCPIEDDRQMRLYIMVHHAITEYLERDENTKTQTHYERS